MKTASVLLLVIFSLTSFAQFDHGEIDPLIYELALQNQSNDNNYVIKVVFHVVSSTTEQNSVIEKEITDAKENLNYFFQEINNTGISFDFSCPTDYTIISDEFYNNFILNDVGDYCEAMCDIDNYSSENALDIFIGKENSAVALGYSLGIPGTTIGIKGMVDGENAIKSSLLIHEIGHALGLFHTYHYTHNICDSIQATTCVCNFGTPSFEIDSTKFESSEGDSLKGDFIADTPGDPLIGATGGCNYESNCLDLFGNPYNPSVFNVMSNFPIGCRLEITELQSQRMRNAIEFCIELQNIQSSSSNICPCFESGDLTISTSNISDLGLSSTIISNQKWIIENELIVDQNFTFDNVEFVFHENAKMTILEDIQITIANSSKLDGCDVLWRGIYMEPNSFLTIENSTLKNAFKGIVVDNANLSLEHSQFIDNYFGIEIFGEANILKFDGNIFQGTGHLLPNFGEDIGSRPQFGIRAYLVRNKLDFFDLEQNTFENLTTAISAYGTEFEISNDLFIDCGQSISAAFCKGNISENEFYNSGLGSIFLFRHAHFSRIENNQFDSSINGNEYRSEINVSHSSRINVSNNEFDLNGPGNGIKLDFNRFIGISENSINIIEPNASNITGITVNGSDRCFINCNSIIDKERNANGILVQLSERTNISCNQIEQCDIAIRFKGDSDVSKIESNLISENNIGLQLDEGPTVIGIQENNGNRFLTLSNANYFADNEDMEVLSSRLITKSENLYTPSQINGPIEWFFFNNENQKSCQPQSDCENGFGSNFDGGGMTSIMLNCTDQIQNNIHWSYLNDCEKGVREFQQYRIAKTSTPNNCQVELINWVESEYTINPVWNAENLLFDNELDYDNNIEVEITNILNSWNIIESNHNLLEDWTSTIQLSLEAMSQSYDYELDQSQISMLQIIASSSLQERGRAVFVAQFLLNYFESTWNNENYSCEETESRNSMIKNLKYVFPQIFPNPLIKNSALKLSKPFSGNIIIYNQFGLRIEENEVSQLSSIELSTFDNGVYFIKLENLEGKSKVSKIILIE